MKSTIPLILVILIALQVFGPLPIAAQPPLPRSAPEAQGIDSEAVLNFLETAERQIDALHSFMLIRHGRVVAEGWWAPYAADRRHELYSLSKSFTATAVGLAVAEGKLSLDDTVLGHFPGEAPADPGVNLKAMRLRDLLSMSTGHEKEPPTSPAQVSVQTFLAQPVLFKPGTRFLYNTAATFVLSAVVQKATGQTVLEYLKPRLFEPLGIVDPTWETNFQGISLGGYGLSLRTEDIARFGLLYRQQGRWQGKQLLPASWVEAATSRQTSNGSHPDSDWDQGYGFQFWRSRHGAYRGDGAFGQYCVVMPEQDAVLAITGGVKDMQAVLNLVWEKLLPGIHEKRLPKNRAMEQALRTRLAGLTLPKPEGQATSPRFAQVAGREFSFPDNEQHLEAIRLEPVPDQDGLVLVVRRNGVEQRVRCGHERWEEGRFAHGAAPDRPMAARGAWSADDTYTARLCFMETPFTLTLRLRFVGDQVFHDSESNVSFGPTRQPQLVGQAR